ncbi:MAG: hypothetical protein KBG28_17895 [Kofleriaceae bacterium]|jgi:hypothetical protein|nr:hypothetical protein [Kofleriaceae bacterium]MBP9205852.1 hypothetical protein [Kofleriaceae bacterium]
MATAAAVLGLSALVAAFLPGVALYLGLGAAIFAGGLAWAGWRDRRQPARQRLLAAGALTLATLALLLLATRLTLVVLAVDRLTAMAQG